MYKAAIELRSEFGNVVETITVGDYLDVETAIQTAWKWAEENREQIDDKIYSYEHDAEGRFVGMFAAFPIAVEEDNGTKTIYVDEFHDNAPYQYISIEREEYTIV